LRTSIDSKAKVKVGNLSRDGKSRTLEPKKADDHDTEWSSTLVPFGILNTNNEQVSIYMGQSAETSDFIVDCLSDCFFFPEKIKFWHGKCCKVRKNNLRARIAPTLDSTKFINAKLPDA